MGKLLDWIELIAMCGFMMFLFALFLGPFSFVAATIIIIKIFRENLKEKNSYRRIEKK